MGIYPSCNLNIMGNLKNVPVSQRKALIDAIDDLGPDLYLEPPTAEKLALGDGFFRFEAISDGKIDPTIKTALDNAGLSYSWQWDDGGDGRTGIKLHDAKSGKSATFATTDNEMCLSVYELSIRKIVRALIWKRWYHRMGLIT